VTLKVIIFDDVLAARGERFQIPGLEVEVYGHADDAVEQCAGPSAPDLVCMDYAMGAEHRSGAEAVSMLRAGGYGGRILAMSSDPSANHSMLTAGASEALDKKAMLRSYLVALGSKGR
jgi:DNA-binding NarL/FixJ family response regulator